MKLKKILAGVLTAATVAGMSVSVMASGSITDAVDTNNVTAETTTADAATTTESTGSGESVGGIEAEIETVGASLNKDVANLYEEIVQQVVDSLNNADQDTTVHDAFLAVFGEEDMPEVSVYKLDDTAETADLTLYKFLSPVMDLTFEEGAEATEENPIDVTFTVNNMTDNIQVDVLHYCEDHQWEVLEGEKVSENQVKASFHSASPVALIYRELPEEETEVDTDAVAP